MRGSGWSAGLPRALRHQLPDCTQVFYSIAHYPASPLNALQALAWLVNLLHLLVVLFLSAWMILKRDARASEIYRCETDYWTSSLRGFYLSIIFRHDAPPFIPCPFDALFAPRESTTVPACATLISHSFSSSCGSFLFADPFFIVAMRTMYASRLRKQLAKLPPTRQEKQNRRSGVKRAHL